MKTSLAQAFLCTCLIFGLIFTSNNVPLATSGENHGGGSMDWIMIRTDQNFSKESLKMVREYVSLVDNVPSNGFVKLTSFDALEDGLRVEANSRRWAERFFRYEASPYREGVAVLRFVHHGTSRTYDLLRHVYTYKNVAVEVTESVQVVLIRLHPVDDGEILRENDEASAGSIAGLTRRILALSGRYVDQFGQTHTYQWAFRYKPPLGEGSCFTTNPDVLPVPGLLRSWAERVDGGIAKGKLFFLGYKNHLSGDGRLIFLSGRHWFDGRCWEPYVKRRYPDERQ